MSYWPSSICYSYLHRRNGTAQIRLQSDNSLVSTVRIQQNCNVTLYSTSNSTITVPSAAAAFDVTGSLALLGIRLVGLNTRNHIEIQNGGSLSAWHTAFQGTWHKCEKLVQIVLWPIAPGPFNIIRYEFMSDGMKAWHKEAKTLRSLKRLYWKSQKMVFYSCLYLHGIRHSSISNSSQTCHMLSRMHRISYRMVCPIYPSELQRQQQQQW